MEFKDVLNRYMERTGCSARDLAERSGLSTATISRYRSGDRVPEADSRQLENLAKGIAAIAAEKKIREMEEEAVRQALSEQAQGPGIEIEKLRLNFDTLLKTLSVSVSDLARFFELRSFVPVPYPKGAAQAVRSSKIYGGCLFKA